MSQTTHPQAKVNRPRRRQGLWTAAALIAVVAAAGCSSSPSPPATNATPGAAAAAAGESIRGISFYRPSTVRSHTGDSAVLTSPDPVTKVTDYYLNVVNRDGWTTVSKSTSPYHANLTIKKSGQGASISVAPSGSGSAITISTYPTA